MELLVVVVIAGILAAVAAPNLSWLIASQRVKGASTDIFSSLIYARSEAITRNTTITVAPVGGGWANGWTITVPLTGLVLRNQDAVNGATIAGPASVSYNGVGRLSAAATPFSLTGTNVNDANSRCITIDLSGRPVVAKGICP